MSAIYRIFTPCKRSRRHAPRQSENLTTSSYYTRTGTRGYIKNCRTPCTSYQAIHNVINVMDSGETVVIQLRILEIRYCARRVDLASPCVWPRVIVCMCGVRFVISCGDGCRCCHVIRHQVCGQMYKVYYKFRRDQPTSIRNHV